MRIIVLFFLLLVACVPVKTVEKQTEKSPIHFSTATLQATFTFVPTLTQTAIPATQTPEPCPPSNLIEDSPIPENLYELIGKYFSDSHDHPKDMDFKLSQPFGKSKSHEIVEVVFGKQDTLLLTKDFCAIADQVSGSRDYFYQITDVILLPPAKKYHGLSWNICGVDGKGDVDVIGWGSYTPGVNELKAPQFAWRRHELTESFEEIDSSHVKCLFNGTYPSP